MNPGRDFIGVGVVYYCHDGKGNVLMNLRGVNCKDENGRWDIGAGSVEFGESLEETLVREIKEEYGANIISKEFLGFREVVKKEKGAERHWVTFDYLVRIEPAEARNAEPHKFDDVRWFQHDQQPEPLHSEMPVFMAKYADTLPK